MFITSADGLPPRMAITVRLLHQRMGNFHGWLVPEVPMPHPEGQRSLTYCINPREGDTNACRLQREALEPLLP